MIEDAVLWEWLSFAVRWLHVITAIAWIGSSFYFIALDLGLRPVASRPQGVSGEEWQVHGGGFYHIQKYSVAPASLPDRLTWFKWESYATWLSGFALLIIVYYAGADLNLVDPNVWDVEVPVAIAASLASLAVSWLVYDGLCRSPLRHRSSALMVVLYLLLLGMAWLLSTLFTGRAAMLHLGAITATIMSANVFLVIIPNQRVVVADLKAGREPDARLGAAAKLRSTHNNYLTLPVLFLMLSNHYPLSFATPYSWVIAGLVFMMGVSIRHYFNSTHARRGRPIWTWAVTAVLFGAIIWLSTLSPDGTAAEATAEPEAATQRFADSPQFQAVHEIVQYRCSMCHADEPLWAGFATAPKGVDLSSEAEVVRHARAVYLHAGISQAMPPANITLMEPGERAVIIGWYRSATAKDD